MADLQYHIVELYRTFGRYSAPEKIVGCPCCINQKAPKGLLHHKLRDIPEDVLWSYVFSVFYTVGSIQDFKYFLPRILELLVEHSQTSLDPEMVFCKLAHAGWLDWPQQEIRAVERYLDAALLVLLQLPLEDWPHDDGGQIESWYCGLSRTGKAITPYLTILDTPQYADKKAHFIISLGIGNGDGFDRGTWWFPESDESEPFACQLDKNRQTILDWAENRA